MNLSTEKRNIIVFGASSFIGKAFISNNEYQFNIIPVYRNSKNHPYNLDFNNTESISDFAIKMGSNIDGILFAQGMNPAKSVEQMTEAHFAEMLRINLTTPVLIIQHLIKKLNTGASVIFISSVSKRKGSYDAAYAAAKSGITGLMYSLANAYPKVRFNIVSLGLVENSPVYNGMSDDFRKKHASNMYNNSFVNVNDVSDVIKLLVTNNSINKADFSVDQGYL
jgi:NAD(P)-dependent dehydrogenase (short-subunit alcohol dehydrogenase family)